jgi:branched-chain amino acid transport system substrate-binding protein
MMPAKQASSGFLYPSRTMGSRWIWSFQTAIADINKAGGVYVKEYDAKIPIEAVIADHASDENKAVTQAEYLCQQGIVAILGTSAALPGAAAVAEKNGVTLMMNGSILRQPYDQGYKYLFSFFCLNDTLAKRGVDLVNSLPADQKPKLIANLVGQDVFGKEGGVYNDKAFTAAGYKVLDIPYTRMTTDLSSQILQMKNAGADFVVGGVLTPDGLLLMKQMKQLGYNPKGMFIQSAPDDMTAWSSLGAEGDYVTCNANFDASFTYPGAQDLASRYVAQFKEPVNEAAGTCYGTVQILAAAITAAGTLDKSKIRDAIAATDMMTVAGPAKFNPNGTSTHEGVIIQWLNQKTGVIAPDNMATTKLIYPTPLWNAR